MIVRAEIENADGLLKSDMFAMFKISIDEASPAPAVPTDAVIREGDVATVWVETEPMLFKRRVVEIGIQQDGLTQIRKGLDFRRTGGRARSDLRRQRVAPMIGGAGAIDAA